MNLSKSSSQIRKETVLHKHYGLTFGLLGLMFSGILFFGLFATFHVKQLMQYPDYIAYSISGLAGKKSDLLRYRLMRYGNENHQYDQQIIAQRWYPRGEMPTMWVRSHGGIAPIYTTNPILFWTWPFTATLLFTIGSFVYGMVRDYRYHRELANGIPMEGSVLATVDDYNAEVSGNGMKYAVKEWSDR